jgi:phosphate transport system protein
MRYARPHHTGSNTASAFWGLVRRLANPNAVSPQILLDPSEAGSKYRSCAATPEPASGAMSSHTRTVFDADLSGLRSEVLEMGALVRQSVNAASKALTDWDLDLAKGQIVLDPAIDSMQRKIENRAVETIARRQPVAVDLRELVSALHIACDLERIGDLAKSICKRVSMIDSAPPATLLEGIRRVSSQVIHQLQLALDSYDSRDAAAAFGVWSRDKDIDAAHASLLRELLTHMMEDPRNVVFCAHLLFCSKNLERMGDRTTNIAESVHYMVTGHHLKGDRPRADDLSFLRPPTSEWRALNSV